jgi:molybdenum cofactor biosynthesis enzyme MoaA
MLQPIAALLAEEATEKLGSAVMIDVMRPVQAYDVGGRARAMSTIIEGLAKAKELGLTPAEVNTALTMVNWGENDGAA